MVAGTATAAAVAVARGPAVRAVLAGVRHLVPVPVERHVVVSHDWPRFLAVVAAHRPGMAVIDSTVPGFDTAGFGDLRGRLGRATMVVLVRADVRGIPLSVDLLRLGADGVVAVGDASDLAGEVARVLEESMAGRVAQAALRAACGGASTPFLTFVERLWVRCRRPLVPEDAASLYHRHPSTLGRHLRAGGLPPVNCLVVWGRLVHAAYLLEDPARPVANVAAVLGFPSASALCNQFSRYVGVTPSDLRHEGLAVVAAEFGRRRQKGDWAVARPDRS